MLPAMHVIAEQEPAGRRPVREPSGACTKAPESQWACEAGPATAAQLHGHCPSELSELIPGGTVQRGLEHVGVLGLSGSGPAVPASSSGTWRGPSRS